MIICILLYLFAMIMSFPTCSKPTKDSLIDIVKPEWEGGKDPQKWHYILVISTQLLLFFIIFNELVCNITGLIFALFIPSMHDVVEVMGGTLSPLVFIFITIVFIKKKK